ncbi:MAG TPA: universal stress protein [Acidimicrobiales bacterium]|nr:universal stress protein [Acidimicrobiales bacterium]
MTASGGTGRATVVVGVDGSDSSRQALRWALHQATVTGAALRVVTCWDYPVSYGWTPPNLCDFNPEPDVHRVLDELVDAVVPADSPVQVERVVLRGHPAQCMVDQAAGAALLVVGTRGHGGFTGLLLGSVGEYCVTHAPCPVVVVRGAGGP